MTSSTARDPASGLTDGNGNEPLNLLAAAAGPGLRGNPAEMVRKLALTIDFLPVIVRFARKHPGFTLVSTLALGFLVGHRLFRR